MLLSKVTYNCILVIHFLSVFVFPGKRTHNLSLLTQCSTIEQHRNRINMYIYAATNSAVGLWHKLIQLYNSFSAIHVIMLELKSNKHNTYYRCTYLYTVNAVIFKLLLSSFLKPDLAQKNNNITTLICLAISVLAKVLHDPLVQYSPGLNLYGNIDELAVLVRGGAVLKCHLSCSPITTH